MWEARVRDLAARTGADARRLVAEHALRARVRTYQGDTAEQANHLAYQHIAANLTAVREAA